MITPSLDTFERVVVVGAVSREQGGLLGLEFERVLWSDEYLGLLLMLMRGWCMCTVCGYLVFVR